MKNIGLLLVGHIDSGSLHIGGDYPDLYADLLRHHDINITTYRCDEGHLPEKLSEQDGYICSPSRLSVYDDHEWLRDVEQLLRDMVATETAYVGICFGHQLMAQALGATVAKAKVGWGIGAKNYEIVEEAWFMDSTQDIVLAASHQDQVMQLPEGARLMAQSPYCPIGGMLIGERAWTLQAHPEFSPALADSLLATRLALFGEEVASAARETLKQSLQQERLAGWMTRFFHNEP
jgi:GMP synthase-like glutamine amidotransferase